MTLHVHSLHLFNSCIYWKHCAIVSLCVYGCCHSYPLCVCVYQVSFVVRGCYDVFGELLSRPLLFYLLQEVWAHDLASMQQCGGRGTVVLNPEVHALHWAIIEGRLRV